MVSKNLLEDLSIFKGLNDSEFSKIVDICTEQKFKKDDIILTEGSESKDLFLVVEGMVDVQIRLSSQLNPVSINIIQPGEIFGEFSFVDGLCRSATAKCLTDTKIIFVKKSLFDSLTQKNSKLGMIVMKNIASILSARIRNTNDLLRDFISRSFRMRGV